MCFFCMMYKEIALLYVMCCIEQENKDRSHWIHLTLRDECAHQSPFNVII